MNEFSGGQSFPLAQSPAPHSVIGSLDRKAVHMHGKLPEVAADPGSVEEVRMCQKLFCRQTLVTSAAVLLLRSGSSLPFHGSVRKGR